MFHAFLAPCDVIKLKYKDITRQGKIHVKRKKTHKAVEIPLNPVMEKIIRKYKGKTKDDYVFPIMDDELEKTYIEKDYIFKNFRECVNVWLKRVGKELRLSYDPYAYVFRHTYYHFYQVHYFVKRTNGFKKIFSFHYVYSIGLKTRQI